MQTAITMQEWQTHTPDTPQLANVVLSSAASRFAADLTQSGRLNIYELRHGLKIQSLSYVGRVMLDTLQITIRPKIDTPALFTLLRYAYNLNNLQLTDTTDFDTERSPFQDLLILQLTIEAQTLISRGLYRRYEAVNENLASPSGRIDVQKIAKQGGIVSGTLPTQHYPRSTDNPLNQTLLAGLSFAQWLTTDSHLRVRIRRLIQQIEPDISNIRLTRNHLQQVQSHINRMTRAYEPILQLISLLYEGYSNSLNDASNHEMHGFLFDMNRFWETLLSRYLRDYLVGYHVQDQMAMRDLFRYTQTPRTRRPPTPRPDFTVHKDGQLLAILDAKYRDIWDKGLPRDMLYQLALYAMSQGNGGRATILYPTTSRFAQTEIIAARDVLGNRGFEAFIVLHPIHLTAFAERITHGSNRDHQTAVRAMI